jgi:polyhydroxyalkanoate synthase subunit PhaE
MNNWQEQNQNWLKIWGDAQEQMMNVWSSAAQSVFNPAPTTTPFMKSYNAMSEFWRELTMQGIRTMTQAADPTARNVAEKMFSNQMGMMRFLQLAMNVWQGTLSAVEAGGNWEKMLTQQMSTVRDEFVRTATEGLHINGSMSQLWQTFMQEGLTFTRPWSDAIRQGMQHMGSGDSSVLIEMTSLYWDAYKETFGNLLQMPGVGSTREMDEKLRHTFAAWLDVQQAMYEYNVVLSNVWLNAFEQLMHGLAQLAEKGENIDSLRDFLNRWSAIADDVFKDAFRSQEYVEIQGKLVNTIMTYRQHQRQVNEIFLQMYDLPTRTEVDEAHQRIYNLRKEVKSLRRELAALRAEINGTPEKKPRRSVKKES